MAACGSLSVDPVPALPATLECCYDCASVSSAFWSATGSTRPRRAARRRIPVAAFGVKQYFDRCGPVSKTSDKEHSLAPLGDGEESRVQHSPAKAIPELLQRPDDGTHCSPVDWHAATGAGTAGGVVLYAIQPDALPVPLFPSPASNSAAVCGAGVITWARADRPQEPGDILKNEPPWAQFVGQPHDLPEQPRTCATQARAAASDREILAGPASGKDSSSWNKSRCPEIITGHLPHVIEQPCAGEMPGDYRAAIGVNLDCRGDFHARPFQRQAEALNAAEQGDRCQVAHVPPPRPSRARLRRGPFTGAPP